MIAQERILEKTEPEPNSGCWLWRGNVLPSGYGLVRPVKGSRKLDYVHRVAYRAWRGNIPLGLCVLHRCDVRSCCNPAHLFLGTPKDNVLDMLEKGRMKFPIGERNVWRANPQALYENGKHLNAKLSVEQVRSLRKATKGNIASLCSQYGIDISTACHIRARQRWKHVED